jgi:hypothetical protein
MSIVDMIMSNKGRSQQISSVYAQGLYDRQRTRAMAMGDMSFMQRTGLSNGTRDDVLS